MSAEVTDILRATDLLGSAPAADLAAIAAASRSRTVRRGQILFTTGDPGESVIVVLSGRVKVVVRSADGGELTLTVIGPGGVIGELSAADGGPRSADAQTLEDCRLLFVPRQVIQELCGRAPSVARALASALAASLRRLTDDTSDLVFLDLPRRVAKALLSQPRDDDGVIGQKMTQEELARRVGGARQSVNAALRGFERRGWIQVRNQSVTVKQPAALSRFAGD